MSIQSELSKYTDSELYAELRRRETERQRAAITTWYAHVGYAKEKALLGQYENEEDGHLAIIRNMTRIFNCTEDEITIQGSIDKAYFQPTRLGYKQEAYAVLIAYADNVPAGLL